MRENFGAALRHVLRHEGGFVNHPSDPGGATNKGITLGTYRAYVNSRGTVEDLRRITDAEVEQVYRRHYWNRVRGDDLPGGMDYAVFDFAVNSGPSRAIKYLQGVLGVAQDGVIGPVTLARAREVDPVRAVSALCDRRLDFLRGLSTWPTFRRGWSARVASVRSDAIRMANAVPIPPPRPTPEPGKPREHSWRPAAIMAAMAATVAIIVMYGKDAMRRLWDWFRNSRLAKWLWGQVKP